MAQLQEDVKNSEDIFKAEIEKNEELQSKLATLEQARKDENQESMDKIVKLELKIKTIE